MENLISKSKFKARALQYFRFVEKTSKPLVITDHGKPTLKIIPYDSTPEDILQRLRGSVVKYAEPTEPVGLDEWNVLARTSHRLSKRNGRDGS